MRFITGPRCTGKTTALMEESARTGIPIIAPSMRMANYIFMLAKEKGLGIPEPMSINKVVNRRGRPEQYYVDELEMCLRQLGIDPVAATMWDGSDMKARDLD